jgi:molecular chaperone GrpE
MSEQDDDTASSSVSAADRTETEGGSDDGTDQESEDAGAGPGAETLSEIARRPDEDVESVLSGIVDGRNAEAGPHENGGTDEERAGRDQEQAVDEIPVDEELVASIEEADPETTARAVQLLQLELDQAEEAIAEHRERADDLESRLKRKQADFQNYKKRQKKRKQEEIERATEDLVSRLLDVRDNLRRALEHDDADIRSGVESTLKQFDSELERENVESIEPEAGDEVDPQRHEVLVTIAADQPADTIAEVHRPGYQMADKVLRPAQVAVSDGSNHDEPADGDETEDGSATDE